MNFKSTRSVTVNFKPEKTLRKVFPKIFNYIYVAVEFMIMNT
jgi:hypothetical protein